MKNLEIKTQSIIKQAEQEVQVVAEGSRIKVVSQPTLKLANDQLSVLKGVKKSVQEKKDSVIKPLNEALKNARLLFSPIEEKIDTIETYLKEQVLSYNEKLLEESRKKEQEAAKKIEQGEDIGKATKGLEKIQEKQAEIKGVRTIKKLRIIDVNKIPREFMIPDEVKIRQALLLGAKVEGAELIEEKILAN
jgi:hypothetical protein